LRLLGRREHSRAELAGKLAPQAESSEALARVLDVLEVKKQLSDERYAEERARQLGRKYGAERVRRDLLERGVAAGTATRLAAAQARGDVERARAILERKFRGAAAATARERARRMRFLQGRGFSPETIRCALGLQSAEW
jgi:regulatory protein